MAELGNILLTLARNAIASRLEQRSLKWRRSR